MVFFKMCLADNLQDAADCGGLVVCCVLFWVVGWVVAILEGLCSLIPVSGWGTGNLTIFNNFPFFLSFYILPKFD
jgi:hypothetical protein